MSKAGPSTGSGNKPRASEPAPVTRKPSGANGPAIQRKASGPVNGQAKFYSGPTVPAPSAATKENVKQAVNEAGGKVVQGAKVSSKSVSRTVRRHRYSILSLLTALPALLFFSLFSTVLCPPPSSDASWLSRQTHSILGLPSAHPMRDTLCAPAYAYHDRVLSPHIYPLLARAQDRVGSHPIYIESVLPAYGFASTGINKAWEGPIKPVVQRIQKGAKRLYLTFIQPHLPYVRKQWYTLTAPYVSRVQAAYTTHAEPHVQTAQKYGLAGAQAVRKGYSDASEHRITREVMKLSKEVQRRAGQTWVYAKPRLVRGAEVAERRWREQARPALIRGAKAVLKRLDKGTAVVRGEIWTLEPSGGSATVPKAGISYQTHLAPTLSPYITRAHTVISPYTALFLKQIYNPYIRPTVEYYFPPPAKPLPPRSFWQMVSDFLPAAGLHAAEHKGSMYENAKVGVKDVKAATASAKVSRAAASKAAKVSAEAASAAASKQAAQAARAGKAASAEAAKKAAEATKAAKESASSVQAQAKASASSVSKDAASVGAAAADSASSVTKDVKTAVSSASQAAQSAATAVEDKAESVVSAATGTVKSAASEATDSASSMYTQAASAASAGTESAKSAASDVLDDASATVDSASKSVESGAVAGKQSAQSVAEKATRAAESATVSVKDAAAKASASVVAVGQMTRAEMDRVVGGLMRRLEGAGEAAEKELVASIVNTYQTFHDETFPKMHSTNKGELAKDIDYVLGGLDKLYSRSTALTAGQIEISGQQAEARVQKKYQAVRQRGKEVKRVIGDMSRPYLIQGEEGVEGGMKRDLEDLEGRVNKMDGVTAADRARIADLRKRVQERKDNLRAIHEGKKTDKAITTASSKLTAAINELSTELDDLFEAFREQVKLYQRVALSKVSARDVVQASPASGSGTGKDAKDGKASILPIVPKPQAPAADVVGAGEAVIGKGEAQVMDALSDLLSSAANRQTQVGAAERVMSSAKSAQSASAGSGPGTGTARRAGETASRSVVAAAMSATDKVRRAGEAASASASSATVAASSATDSVKASAKSAGTAAGSAAAEVSDSVKSAATAVSGQGQDAMESVKSVMSAASASVGSAAAEGTARAKGVGAAAGRVGQDAAGVAEAAMAHDEL